MGEPARFYCTNRTTLNPYCLALSLVTRDPAYFLPREYRRGRYSAKDLTGLTMCVGLLGEALPSELGQMSFMVYADDPLTELQILPIQKGAVQPLSQLLSAEHVIGGCRASAIERFSLAQPIVGRRRSSFRGGSRAATRTSTRSCVRPATC